MTRLFFDIETGPLPVAKLAAIEPEFHAPRNIKDPAKIAAAVSEKRQAWLADAALSAMTGQVLCIGCLDPDKWSIGYQDDHASERDVIESFWARWAELFGTQGEWIGWCIHSFDLPFLVQRSWLLGIQVPDYVRGPRFWNDRFIDLALHWSFGDRQKVAGLDVVAKAFGIGGKIGHGKDFATLFATDRDAALAYCETDVRLTAELWRRMQV